YVDVNGDGHYQAGVDRLLETGDLSNVSIDDGGLVVPAGGRLRGGGIHISVKGNVHLRGDVDSDPSASLDSREGSVEITSNAHFCAAHNPVISAEDNVFLRSNAAACVWYDSLTIEARTGRVVIAPNAVVAGGETINLIADKGVVRVWPDSLIST